MLDLSFLQILSRLIAIIIVLAVMGFSLAGFARLLGDKGMIHDGKLSLNPLTHIDIFALVAGVAGRIGWLRPVNIDPLECRGHRVAPVLAAIGAMTALFFLGRVAGVLQPWVATSWPTSSASFATATLRAIGDTAGWTLAANAIPVPPLLGGYLVQAIAPATHDWLGKRHSFVSFALSALVIFSYGSLSNTPFGGWASTLGRG